MNKFKEMLEEALRKFLEDKPMSYHRRTKMQPPNPGAVDEAGQTTKGAQYGATREPTLGAFRGGNSPEDRVTKRKKERKEGASWS